MKKIGEMMLRVVGLVLLNELLLLLLQYCRAEGNIISYYDFFVSSAHDPALMELRILICKIISFPFVYGGC